jgi:hypothetical protein
MSKMVIECSNPNDMNEIDSLIDQIAGRCNITYFKQHEAMVEAGISKSIRGSARRIAKDEGGSQEAIKMRILRGKKHVEQVVPQKSQPIENITDMKIDETERPEIIENLKKQHGGMRKLAGRKSTSHIVKPINLPSSLENSYNVFKYDMLSIKEKLSSKERFELVKRLEGLIIIINN